MSEEPEPTLTDEESEQGWRLVRLGSGPWRKVPPGTKLAADYLREHRARRPGSDTAHQISTLQTPINFIVRCACGWTRTFPRENALARAAKIKAAIRKHENDIQLVRARVADRGARQGGE